ncbi:transcriptional repressor DicA (plasmid) [Mycobacterium sp. THAF192]|nr:transcriptional repressor DicA [Mycobacterium sp. THAF192]
MVRGFQRERFTQLRVEAGMTMSDRARLAEVAPSTIASWERRGGAPDVRRLAKVAAVLQVSAPVEK